MGKVPARWVTRCRTHRKRGVCGTFDCRLAMSSIDPIADITDGRPGFPSALIDLMESSANPRPRGKVGRGIVETLLLCGIGAAVLYAFTDIIAAAVYPGFSYSDQAVSELFAIGAPTSYFVVPLFTASSALLLAFSAGVALSSHGSRRLQILAWMFAASAIDAIVLWNVYPMHMRGEERTFTDLMHLILASNPFVLATLVISIFAFQNAFRRFTVAILSAVLLLSVFGFSYATAVDTNGATPGLGLIERLGQYLYQLWQAMLAAMLLRMSRSADVSRMRVQRPLSTFPR